VPLEVGKTVGDGLERLAPRVEMVEAIFFEAEDAQVVGVSSFRRNRRTSRTFEEGVRSMARNT
jgi:hypothetical protein